MTMGRPKNFSRDDVLDKSIPVFWEHGFAGTTLSDLEEATGVNRSGLYSEFKDKEDLFLAGLLHYIETSGLTEMLAEKPLGWGNVEKYLKLGLACWDGQKGCFSVNSMRELAVLPQEARNVVAKSMKPIKQLLVENIEAEIPEATTAAALADLAMTFFSGISIEQNLAATNVASLRKIETFMKLMRVL
jgi:TetR/AcrR family transcriptional regulator, copper-responsive repressor